MPLAADLAINPGACLMTGIPEGFETMTGLDQAEDHIGPFYYRSEGDGFRCVFLAEAKNSNMSGLIHGGVLMAFADYALCLAATDGYLDGGCATVSFSAEFVATAEVGYLIECTPKVIRKTGSMVFVTGELLQEGKVLIVFNSVVKRLRKG